MTRVSHAMLPSFHSTHFTNITFSFVPSPLSNLHHDKL
jgi:hypothetical protein